MRLRLIVVLSVITFCRCHFSGPTRIYYKEITVPGHHFEWFFYSTLEDLSPDYVTVTSNNIIDTLCVAEHVKDIVVEDSVITLKFYGDPLCNSCGRGKIKSIEGYSLNIDSSYARSQYRRPKYYWK